MVLSERMNECFFSQNRYEYECSVILWSDKMGYVNAIVEYKIF